MTYNPDAAPQHQPLPDHKAKGVFRNLRYRLIEWLAHGDAVMLNVEMVIPSGWMLCRRNLNGGLIVDNHLALNRYEPVPNTLLLIRDELS